jgi:hypothetical protein
MDSDSGTRAPFYHEVYEAQLTRIIRVDLKSAPFTYDIDEAALTHARMMAKMAPHIRSMTLPREAPPN